MVGESFRLTAIGLVVGFALSLAVAAVLSRFLFGITPTDPPTFLGVFALLTAASLVACYMPARRAARIDPMTRAPNGVTDFSSPPRVTHPLLVLS